MQMLDGGRGEFPPDVQLIHPGLSVLAGLCRLCFPTLGLLLLVLLLVLLEGEVI